ncbi:MAG: hypothetical protein AB7E47_15505 [Desulfovibrionaceae bacterium]
MMRRTAWIPAAVAALVMMAAWALPARSMVIADIPVGTWIIRSYKMSGASAWGNQYAELFLNRTVRIEEHAITFGASTCGVNFESQEHNTATYFHAHHHTGPLSLGIAASTFTLVKSNCSITGFDRLLFFGGDTLVMSVDTVFFFMERVQ